MHAHTHRPSVHRATCAQATFTASAIYNIIGCGIKRFTAPLRRVDHACIYLMIAGSYTPFMLLLPDGAISRRIHNDAVLTLIWIIAFLGAALKLILARRFETPGLVLYVALGCAVVSFTHAVKDGYAGGWRLLLEFAKSGACYLGGMVFYLDDDIPQSNALWCVHPAFFSFIAWYICTRFRSHLNTGTHACSLARCCTHALCITWLPWAKTAFPCEARGRNRKNKFRPNTVSPLRVSG